MTEKAIRILRKNPKGFFLLVEGVPQHRIQNATFFLILAKYTFNIICYNIVHFLQVPVLILLIPITTPRERYMKRWHLRRRLGGR